MTDPRKAVVALSGGQDSGTCLFYAREAYDDIHAVSFDYGQRHRIELECAEALADLAGCPHTVLDIAALAQLGDAALTSSKIGVAADASGTGNTHAEKHDLPSTFVPGRNVILLGLAAAYAVPRGLGTVVTGVCQMDDAGYPDCRAVFLDSFEATLNLALGATPGSPLVMFDAPLMDRDKADTWELAAEHGVVDTIVKLTHTCYEGDHDHLHEWGYGCGECPACETRANGWIEFVARQAQPA